MPTQTVQKNVAVVRLADVESAIGWLQANLDSDEYHIRGVTEEIHHAFRVEKTIQSAKIVFKCPEKALLFRRRSIMEVVYPVSA